MSIASLWIWLSSRLFLCRKLHFVACQLKCDVKPAGLGPHQAHFRLHQPHSPPRGSGALARGAAGDPPAQTPADHLPDQPGPPRCTYTCFRRHKNTDFFLSTEHVFDTSVWICRDRESQSPFRKTWTNWGKCLWSRKTDARGWTWRTCASWDLTPSTESLRYTPTS